MHYKRVRYGLGVKGRQPVPKPSCAHCEREAIARGLCPKHWKQWRLNGDPLHADNRRQQSADFRIGRGYVFRRGSLVPEHREITGAKPEEVVHHINGVKHDNRLENLAVLANQAVHSEVHASLESIAYELVREGVVVFDRESLRYVWRRT
jgi:hypothetical protein